MTAGPAAGRSVDPVDIATIFDPYDYAFHEDPYPVYAQLRGHAPLYHNADLGFFALSRHEDVVGAFRDNIRLSNANGVSLDPTAYGPHASKVMSFLAMDDPRHARMRSLVQHAFTVRRIRELEPRIVELAREHLDIALAGSEFDFIAEFAGKLPMDVISEMVGVPADDRDHIRKLADAVMHRDEGVQDVPASAVTAALELVQYYTDMVGSRRARRTTDLTSALLDAQIDGDRLTDKEIIGFLFLLVVAGNETTTKLLGNAVYWGARNPEELAKPFANPARIPDWISETLRYDTSSQLVVRTAAEDIRYHGVTVPAGSQVLLLIGSANRDDRVFPRGDRFDIDRQDTGSLASFGGGVHFCLGANLARLETRVALEELLARVGEYEVDEANSVRVHSSNVRGFARLPVRVRRR
jgi:cytochrome P450